jgi:hypothetical protein
MTKTMGSGACPLQRHPPHCLQYLYPLPVLYKAASILLVIYIHVVFCTIIKIENISLQVYYFLFYDI